MYIYIYTFNLIVQSIKTSDTFYKQLFYCFLNPSVRSSIRRPSSIRPFVHSSVRPSVCPSVVRPSIRPCSSIRPSVCQSIRPSVCPSVRPSVRPFVHSIKTSDTLYKQLFYCFLYPSVRPFVRPSVRRPSVHSPVSVHPFVCLFVHPFIHPSVCLSVHPSIHPSVSPSVRPFRLSVPSIRPSVHPS